MSIVRALMGPPGERRDIFANSSIIPSVENASAGLSQESATRFITVMRCNQLLADTVSTLPVGGYVKRGDDRAPIERPEWLDHPVPEDPNMTWVEHVSSGMWSYGLDGNVFTLVLPNVYDPAALYILDPAKVEAKKGPTWKIKLDSGSEVIGPDQMIHISRARKAGTLRGMSPIDEASAALAPYRQALGFASKVFTNGAYMSGYVAIPGPLSGDDRKSMKLEIDEQYGGVRQMKPGIFANGAEWKVPQLSLQDLQFLDLQKFSKAEIATLYGVPPHLVGITEPGAVAYASVEQQAIDFEKFTVRPIVIRFEAGYRRLLAFPDQYIKFNTSGLLRGDIKSRAEAENLWLQAKVIRRSEVRALEEFPPDPEADAYLETPNNNAANYGAPQQRDWRARSLAVITGGRS